MTTPPSEIIDRIEALNQKLAGFWKVAHGWAPIETAGLLSKARLDWQVSLSISLHLWLREPPKVLSDGELILAWTNLGALIEGTLKLFLSIYYKDFRADMENLKAAGALNRKTQSVTSPDGLTLEPLRKYVKARGLVGPSGDDLIKLAQERRNAIHAFQDRPIGDRAEFWHAVSDYLDMLSDIDNRLPYP